jgi:hypothetical protein
VLITGKRLDDDLDGESIDDPNGKPIDVESDGGYEHSMKPVIVSVVILLTICPISLCFVH